MSDYSDNYIFTSESVSEGHPDKICDQISDLIVDLYMRADSNSRVACETLTTTNRVILSGEVKINKNEDQVNNEIIEQKIREKVKEIGYEQDGFHWQNLQIENHLHQQSQDISQGVDSNNSIGAGDQGIMFGFACSDTQTLMPAPIYYSHKLLLALSKFRKNTDSFFRPDSKSQVSMEYENNVPKKIKSVVLSTQHLPDVDNNKIRKKVVEIIEDTIPQDILPKSDEILVNPTGRFVIGGPDGDTGLTGRKIIVDTYGGSAPHGGGAFSGKDYTKVDRSAAYIARYLAKNVVASKLAKKCLIQLSYAIGVDRPISIYLKTDVHSKIDSHKIIKIINNNVDLSPEGIKNYLKLDRPIYQPTATYGHFGRKFDSENGFFSWEQVDLAEQIANEY
ncbi:MAG: methionine adenosyltransferase [Alphaproteobacteria bacterium]